MTENETTWATVRAKYTALFTAPPQPLDDNDIGTVFHKHPFDVIRELDRLAKAYADGKVHSPWRACASRLDKIAGDHDHIDVTADLRIRQAEAWIRNAGLYCPNEEEVIAELFSDVGGGKGYSGGLLCGLQAELGDRMLTLYRNERRRALHAEHDQQTRATPAKEPAAA